MSDVYHLSYYLTLFFFFFFFLILPPPPTSTLFPYTTLFRSANATGVLGPALLSWLVAFMTNAYWVAFVRGKRSEEHTSELQSRLHLVCRLLLEKKKKKYIKSNIYIKLDRK